MAAIALLWLLSSPPNPLDSSGSSSERGGGSRNTSRTLIAVFSVGGTFLLIVLVFAWAKCNSRRKKNKKAIPADLGVRKVTRTDQIELGIVEPVGKKASSVTGFDQLNKNNKKTATSSNIGKLNIEKHGENDGKKAEATTSDVKDDQLNINKRGKNKKKETEVTTLEVDQLNTSKRSKNDKNKFKASTSGVKVDQLNINKCGKNYKKEAETTTSNVRVDKLNIDKSGKNGKKEAEATASDIRVDQLNIDKTVENDKKEAGATTSYVRVDQLNINKLVKNDKKEAEVNTSDIRVDKLNINKRGEHDKKDVKVDIDKRDKNDKNEAEASASNVRVDQMNIDKRGKNDKKGAEITILDVKADQLNINKRDKNNKKETKATTSDAKVDQLSVDRRDKNDKNEVETAASNVRVDTLNIDKRGKKNKKKVEAIASDVNVKYEKNDKGKATSLDEKNDKGKATSLDEDKSNIYEHEKKNLKKDHLEKVATLIRKVDEQKPRRYTVEELKASTENFKKRLGAGGYGDVYKGKSPDGVDIAVKVLKTIKCGENLAAKQFMAEIKSTYNTHHINVVRLFGFCYEDDEVDSSNPNPMTALVFEYMENGSLDEYLSGKKKHELEFKKLYDIAIGTAKGLVYLHDACQQQIVHSDIKPANIILDSKFTPKVCDFGLAKLYDRDYTHTSLSSDVGTYGYMAPEVFQSRQLAIHSDVYSFGIVLFNIVGRKRQTEDNNYIESLSDWFPICVRDATSTNRLEELIGGDCDISGEYDKDKAIRACKVGLLCVQTVPSSRPLMSQVVRMLEGADPINLPEQWPFQNLKAIPTPEEKQKGFNVLGMRL